MVKGLVRVDPAFHGQMLATWHSFGDGLYYPALVGMLGPMELAYVVLQNGVCPGFATWREARDVAAVAKQERGVLLCRLGEQEEGVPFGVVLQSASQLDGIEEGA